MDQAVDRQDRPRQRDPAVRPRPAAPRPSCGWAKPDAAPGEAAVEVRPLTATLGAEVTGVDLAEQLPDDVMCRSSRRCTSTSCCSSATRTRMTPQDQVRFASWFGPLRGAPVHPAPPATVEHLAVLDQTHAAGGRRQQLAQRLVVHGAPSLGSVLAGRRSCPRSAATPAGRRCTRRTRRCRRPCARCSTGCTALARPDR